MIADINKEYIFNQVMAGQPINVLTYESLLENSLVDVIQITGELTYGLELRVKSRYNIPIYVLNIPIDDIIISNPYSGRNHFPAARVHKLSPGFYEYIIINGAWAAKWATSIK